MKSKLQTLRDLLYETETKKTVFSEQPEPLTTEDKRAFAESLKAGASESAERLYLHTADSKPQPHQASQSIYHR